MNEKEKTKRAQPVKSSLVKQNISVHSCDSNVIENERKRKQMKKSTK